MNLHRNINYTYPAVFQLRDFHWHSKTVLPFLLVLADMQKT